MTTTLVNCRLTDPILPGAKYRTTFQRTLAGDIAGSLMISDTMAAVYNKLSVSPICYPVSEPPVDNADVYVVDLKVAQSVTGSARPGSVTEFLNHLTDLLLGSIGYSVARVENLALDAPQVEGLDDVTARAEADKKAAGLQNLLATGAENVKSALGGVKNVAIALAVIIGAVAIMYVVSTVRKVTPQA